MGMLLTNGIFKDNYITALIIKMARDGFLKIKEIEKKVIFHAIKDFEFENTISKNQMAKLDPAEKIVFESIFAGKSKALLSELKKGLFKNKIFVASMAKKHLMDDGYIEETGLRWAIATFLFAIIGAFLALNLIKKIVSPFIPISFGISAIYYSFFQ